jgi:hybrid cluster-associated redox disulfide protein
VKAFFSKDWTVQQALAAHPEAIHVFIRLKTDCIGCKMEHFCSLEEVCNQYGLQLEILLTALEGIIPRIYPKE